MNPVRTSHLAVSVRESSVVFGLARGGASRIVPVSVSPADTVKVSSRTRISKLSIASDFKTTYEGRCVYWRRWKQKESWLCKCFDGRDGGYEVSQSILDREC